MPGLIDDQFKAELNRMDMLPLEGETSNFFLVADKDTVNDPHIRIALEQAERYQANAVFFRIFPESTKQSPIPQIYIYHDITLTLDRQSWYAEIHRRLWNAGVVPLVYIFTASDVKVLNCRQEPKVDKVSTKPLYSPYHKLERLVAEHAFVTRALSTGTFWDDPAFKSDFSLEKTAYYKLLYHLRAFRERLIAPEKRILSEEVANRLLVMAILVKYLNDRVDSAGNRVFQPGFFCQFSRAKVNDLATLFREPGSCVKLFDGLSKHFNGRIFELTENERAELAQANLSLVADFLQGDQEPTGQGLFWPLYSFDDLPVELISNIYEEFLAKKNKESSKGVVYIPPMLVEFLLDQCLPISPDTLNRKILDPACGSGIFLVGAFKRLIQCWRLANGWKKPTHLDLKRILQDSIYGCDRNSEAVLITAFSLCVALCDELDPVVIWNELKFDDLRQRNLRDHDFFEIIENREYDRHFDLIIGNPPFESELTTEAAYRVENAAAQQRPNLPDKQLALLFLEQCFRLAKPGADVCLIQPAGPLLYNGNAQSFRGYLFKQFNIGSIFDFTPLEGVLFKAQVAAAAVLAKNLPASTDKVLHLTFRRTRATKEKLLLELDPYDFHWISRDTIAKNKFVWKANLLGGGRLHRMLERILADVTTLGEYLEDKRKKYGWDFGEGYSVGCGSYLNEQQNIQELAALPPGELKRIFNLKRTPKLAPWITDKPDMPPEALSRNGINRKSIVPCDKTFFEEPRKTTKKIFSPPHVLIREKVDGLAIPAAFTNQYLVFTNQILGIHAPDKEKEHLHILANRLNDSKLFGILVALVSGRILVGRSNSLYVSDILALPYPEDVHEIDLNFWEQALVDDIANFLVEFRRKGEKASILTRMNKAELHSFGKMYCNILNSVYKQFQPLDPIYMEYGSYICYPFCFGDAPRIELPNEDTVIPFLADLLHLRHGSRLFINRILRIYEQNVILMIKPNQKRYWLRSIALRDADETLVDLLEQGY
jgi:type I restriction-modification system DNA methylase subunit